MAALRVSRRSLEGRYLDRTKALLELAVDLPARPTPDQIHDLRVTARRLQMMRRLLPREVRGSQSFRRFGFALKSVLRATSQLRDLDTLMDTLELHKTNLPGELFVTMENRRSDAAAHAKAAADVLAEAPAPNLDPSKLKGKRLTKRLKRRVRKSRSSAAELITQVLNDESKVEQLHALRKEVKKIRYLLELADGSPSELPSLTKWQESLGAIHDLDVAIAYLEGSRIESKGRAILELQRARNSKYLKLVREYRTDLKEAFGKENVLPVSHSPAHGLSLA
jgi:CHAD domain-containing protein